MSNYEDPQEHASELGLTFTAQQADFLAHHIRNSLQVIMHADPETGGNFVEIALDRLKCLANTVEERGRGHEDSNDSQ